MSMRKLTLFLTLALSFSAICAGAKTDAAGFTKLSGIYDEATKALDEMQTSSDKARLIKILEELERECNDPAVQAVLKQTNSEQKDEYEKAQKKREAMEDAVKRLSMAGILQSPDIAAKVSKFVKSTLLDEQIGDKVEEKSGAPRETKAQRDARMKWWRDGKFGMFIHYGLYSGLAGEFQGKKYAGCVEWIQMQSGADFDTYKKEAMPRFKPKKGMAEQWVKLAKEAGCTYTVLTSRHHEGFNLFETPNYDFNAKKVYGIDIAKEYDAACKKYGIKEGYYFSLLDWNHPDYDPTGSGISYPAGNYHQAKLGKRTFGNHEKYKDYLFDTFNQLINNHQVDLVWWDFSQPNFQGDAAWGSTRLMKALFAKNPNAIQNNRLYHSQNHLSEGGIRVTPTWKGDYSTAEQHVPATGIDGDWEACQTLNGTWGYSADNQNWKSVDSLIRQLIDATSRGGNFLLNIGPEPDGSIPKESVRLFREIGKWMKANGEAIYGTRASPFPQEFAWGRVTRKGNDKLYVILYAKPANGIVELPCLFKNGKVKARVLHDKKRVKVTLDEKQKKCILDVGSVNYMPAATAIELSGEWMQ